MPTLDPQMVSNGSPHLRKDSLASPPGPRACLGNTGGLVKAARLKSSTLSGDFGHPMRLPAGDAALRYFKPKECWALPAWGGAHAGLCRWA